MQVRCGHLGQPLEKYSPITSQASKSLIHVSISLVKEVKQE